MDDGALARCDKLLPALGTYVYAFGAQEADVSDAEEAEHRREILLLKIDRG